MLPAAGSFEKEGSVSNSGRWVQWRYRAVMPPEEAMPDLDMMIRLFKKIRELYVKEGGVFADPIVNLGWDYSDEEEADVIAREMNGYALVPGIPKSGTPGATYEVGELIDWFNDLQTGWQDILWELAPLWPIHQSQCSRPAELFRTHYRR